MLCQLCACGLEIAFLDCSVSLGGHLGELSQSPPSPPPDLKVSLYICVNHVVWHDRNMKHTILMYLWVAETHHADILILMIRLTFYCPSSTGVVWAWEGRSSLSKPTPGIILPMVMGRSSSAPPSLQPPGTETAICNQKATHRGAAWTL